MTKYQQFTPSAVPENLEEVTAELLGGLHDATWSWGAWDHAGGNMYLWVPRGAQGQPREVLIIVNEDLRNANYCVRAMRSHPIKGQHHCVNLKCGANVRVDTALDASDLVQALEAIHARAVIRDLYDPRTDTHGVSDRTRQIVSLSAGSIFCSIPSRYIPQGRPVAELLRAQFERPNLVEVIDGPLGVPVLCHTNDASRLAVVYALADEVYRGQQITTFAQLQSLPHNRLDALHRQIRLCMANIMVV